MLTSNSQETKTLIITPRYSPVRKMDYRLVQRKPILHLLIRVQSRNLLLRYGQSESLNLNSFRKKVVGQTNQALKLKCTTFICMNICMNVSTKTSNLKRHPMKFGKIIQSEIELLYEPII